MAIDVARWLQQLGLEQYEPAFRDNDIDGDVLPDLTAEDLIGMGVTSIGHRRKLVSAIAALGAEAPAAPLPGAMAPTPAPVTAPVPLTPPAPGPPQAGAERRQLTVMFCDLVGSTALSTAMDPEDLRDVITSFQTKCADAVKRYDGFVAKYMGDGILVYFCYPRAHEDGPERSARAALDIVAAMADLNASVPRPPGVELTVRLGIATGPVIVGDQIGEGTASETAVIGETPNLAARLQALAEPNQIVIGASTRAMLGDHFDLQDMGPHALKGFSDPVLAWRVLSVRDTESRFAARQTGKSMPLVGRQAEMGLLLRAWEGSSQGRGQVVLIQGEAGIGKSRMLEGLREATGKNGTWVAMRGSHFHSTSAFYPIIEHLKRVMGWQPEDTAAERFAKLEQALRGFKALPLAESVPLIANLMSVPWPEDRYPAAPVSAQQRRSDTLDALTAWLLEVAEHGPVLMVWEDLHWVDPTTLEILGNLIEQAPTAPILVVATYRPELTPPWTSRSHTTPITLKRLERSEVAAIVSHVVEGKSLPGEVLDHIVAKSDGVPLYVEELTKAIVGSGVLEDRGGAYVLNGALSRLNIPETLQDSLMARLDRSPGLREVAQLGSVLGREFAYEMISALIGVGEPRLQSSLGQLVVDELLYQRGRPPRSRYLFKHALIQDAAYQSLLKRIRQQYHQQVAQLMEERFPDVVSTQPELLAHHYTEANCPAEAIAYWLKAGTAAARQWANVEAIDQFGKGLDLVAALPDTRERDARELDLRMALGPALFATITGGDPAFGRTSTRALELCEKLGDDIRGFAALRCLQLYHLGRGELIQSWHFAEKMLRVADRLDGAARLVGVHQALGTVLFFQGKLDQARSQYRLALEKFDPDSYKIPGWSGSHPAIQCQFYGALISWMFGYPDQAMQEFVKAVKEAEAVDDPLTLAQTLSYGSLIPVLRHEPSVSNDYAARAVSICEERRFTNYYALAVVAHGWALCASGETKRGLVQIAQAVDGYRSGAVQQFLLLLQADARLASGKYEAALASAAFGLTLVEKMGGSPFEAELHRLEGEAMLAGAGTMSEAEAAMEKGLDVARRQNAKSWELRCATSMARLWQRQGRHEDALALLAPVYGWFTEGFDTADLRTARALLDELVEGADAAVRDHEGPLRVECGHPPGTVLDLRPANVCSQSRSPSPRG